MSNETPTEYEPSEDGHIKKSAGVLDEFVPGQLVQGFDPEAERIKTDRMRVRLDAVNVAHGIHRNYDVLGPAGQSQPVDPLAVMATAKIIREFTEEGL